MLRQLLTESFVLSLVGGAMALALASWGVKVLVAVDPTSIPRADAITLSFPVLAFTVGLSLLTGVLFGLVPVRRDGPVRP